MQPESSSCDSLKEERKGAVAKFLHLITHSVTYWLLLGRVLLLLARVGLATRSRWKAEGKQRDQGPMTRGGHNF